MAILQIDSANERRINPRFRTQGKARIGDYSGPLINISIDGMLATMNGEPEVGRIYPCRVELQGDSSPILLEMTAVPKHAQRVGHRHEFRVGIEFAEIPEATHWLLMDYLAGGGDGSLTRIAASLISSTMQDMR